VFPTLGLTKEEFCQTILDTTNGIEKIDFNIKCTAINKDAFNEYYHSFLVPDGNVNH